MIPITLAINATFTACLVPEGGMKKANIHNNLFKQQITKTPSMEIRQIGKSLLPYFFDKNTHSHVKIFSVSFYKKTQNKPTFYSTITYTIQLPKPQIFQFYGKIYILYFEIKKTTTYCGLVACPRGIEPRTEP